MNRNYVKAFGSMAKNPIILDEEDSLAQQEQQKLMPREAIMSDKPAPKPFLAAPVNERIASSDLANQLKQLQDLEDVGAFEAPESDANKRAAKLRSLLGK